MLNEDYKDMLQSLLDHEVRFLVVGAYALGAHGYPRATGDIDIITIIDGVEFKKAYCNKEEITIDSLPVPFLSQKDLITNKESTGRPKDKLDAEYLKKLKQE